jgi:sodium-dependent dicarboxylate transporter 2/3/5
MKEYQKYKKIGFVLGPLLFILLYLYPLTIISPEAQKVMAIAAWMICWWITEAVSISVTALIPLLMFPLIGVMDIKSTSAHYGNHIIYLFFGGFVMALALEKVQLHKRIALNIIKLTGTSPDRVVLGFMLSTALLSMWISNTASTIVMLPIALQVIKLLTEDEDGFSTKDQNFALSIMLAIAFSANIGGISTIIGTPPNVVLVGILENEHNIEISFVKWMIMGIPFALIMLLALFIVIVKWIYPSHLKSMNNAAETIDNEIKKLGPWSKREKMVISVFCLTITLWILRATINNLFPDLNLSDTSISMVGAMLMFTLAHDFKNGGFILDWEDTTRLPWGILILFGGGLALASALSDAGIIDLIGQSIATKEGLSVFLITALLITVMVFMTELMSNVALVAIFVPVVAGIALGLNVSILHMCIPIAMASSCAFMLPMATPPNAIVFASGYIKVYEMAKVGVILNIISVLLLLLFTKMIIPLIF